MDRYPGVSPDHTRHPPTRLPPASIWWAFLSAGLAITVILVALGAALAVYQRRFVALHRNHAIGLMRAQEEERAWVAREVHDDALQRIAMLLHEVDDWSNGPKPKQTDALRAEIEDLSVVLRRLAYRLHPPDLDRDLVQALNRLASDLSQSSGVEIQVQDQRAKLVEIGPDRMLVAYRVVQEALNNLIKHSQSASGRVVVRQKNGVLDVAIEDGGRGFDMEQARNLGGLGLVSMTERARAAGGTVVVWSKPGAGTSVRLQLPSDDRS